MIVDDDDDDDADHGDHDDGDDDGDDDDDDDDDASSVVIAGPGKAQAFAVLIYACYWMLMDANGCELAGNWILGGSSHFVDYIFQFCFLFSWDKWGESTCN